MFRSRPSRPSRPSRLSRVLGGASAAVLALSGLIGVSAAQAATTWEIAESPTPVIGGFQNTLNGVSCVENFCMAVGQFTPGAGTARTLAMVTTNGTDWSEITTPNPGVVNFFTEVSCVSNDNCTAIGGQSNGMAFLDLVASWDGAAWTVRDVGSGSHNLASIACVDATRCFAVGDSAVFSTVDGTNWSLNGLSLPGDSPHLAAVACSDSQHCTAVGGYYDNGSKQLIVSTDNGQDWTIDDAGTSGYLSGVSCADATHCVVVGQQGQILVRSTSDGSTWSAQDAAGLTGGLTAVSCSDATHCTAVGGYSEVVSGWYLNRTVAVSTADGRTWSVNDTPNPNPRWSIHLNAASCAENTGCTAVGSLYNAGQYTFVMNSKITEDPVLPPPTGSTPPPSAPSPVPAPGTPSSLSQSAKCVLVPKAKGKKALKQGRKIALTKKSCRTTIGKKVTVKCTTPKKNLKVRCFQGEKRWWIRTPAKRTVVTIKWQAAGNSTHAPYALQAKRKSR